MLATRFGARGQIRLVNHRDHLADRPMATRENLRRAAQTLAERSGPEDLVFIYLTSHGTTNTNWCSTSRAWNWPTCPPTNWPPCWRR
jgi:hypothetical protein